MSTVELESVKKLTGKSYFYILSFVEGFWINKEKQHIINQFLLRQLLESSCGYYTAFQMIKNGRNLKTN
jgi:hypothetical protein